LHSEGRTVTKYYREGKLEAKLAEQQSRGINDIPGLYRGEPEFLCEMAAQAPYGVGLEIGVRFGYSIIHWGGARQGRGEIIGIELEDRPLMWNNIDASGLPIDIVIGDSATVTIPQRDLAFLFIDGDHRKQGLKADMARFIPWIMPGGIVVFHDYKHDRKRYPEFAVTEIVKDWRKRSGWQKLGRVRHAIAFQRPAA